MFEVGNRVHIKDTAHYSFVSVHVAFEHVNGEGVITEIDDDYGDKFRGAPMYKVYTADGRQWDMFSADELERIEASDDSTP